MQNKRFFGFLLILMVSLSLQSCMQMEVLIHVRKNGSGTMELLYTMSPELAVLFYGTSEQENKDRRADEEKRERKRERDEDTDMADDIIEIADDIIDIADDIIDIVLEEDNEEASIKEAEEEKREEVVNPFDERFFEAESKKYSSDLELVSYEEIRETNSIGGWAVFKFRNINSLNTSLTPSASENVNNENLGSDEVTFSFKRRGRKRFLTITMNENNSFASNIPAKSVDEDEYYDDEYEDNYYEEEEPEIDLSAFKSMLKDMFISFKVSVDGRITYSNSDYVEDNVVTILESDFNKIIAYEEALEEGSEAGDGEEEEEEEEYGDHEEYSEEIDGLKFTNVSEIVIEFE